MICQTSLSSALKNHTVLKITNSHLNHTQRLHRTLCFQSTYKFAFLSHSCMVLELMLKVSIETFLSDRSSVIYHFLKWMRGEERVRRKDWFQMGADSPSCCLSAQLHQEEKSLFLSADEIGTWGPNSSSS